MNANRKQELLNIIDKRSKEVLDKVFRKYGLDLDMLPVHSIKGQTGGHFKVRNGIDLSLGFNLELMDKNLDQYINDVIPHEICHYVVWRKHGWVKPHGVEWKIVMRALGFLATITHNMDISGVIKGYRYKCDCKEYILSKTCHNRQQIRSRYSCGKCKSNLEFIG